jgi:hypothetical protein
MKSISVSDLSQLVDECTIDCFVLDEESMGVAQEFTKTYHPLILRCPSTTNCCQQTVDARALSHDVFKSLDNVLSRNDYMGQRDISRVISTSCFDVRKTNPLSLPIQGPDKRFIMLLWSKVLDRVYPHVWDELKQVYNVEFFKMGA